MKICFTVDAEQHAAILAYAKQRGFANSGQFARGGPTTRSRKDSMAPRSVAPPIIRAR